LSSKGLAVEVADAGDLNLAVTALELGGHELPADVAKIDAGELAKRNLDALPLVASGVNAIGGLAAVAISNLDLELHAALQVEAQVLEARKVLAESAETSTPSVARDGKDSVVTLAVGKDHRAGKAGPVVQRIGTEVLALVLIASALVEDGVVGLRDELDVLDDEDDLFALLIADDVEGSEQEKALDLAEVEALERLENDHVVAALGNDPDVNCILLALLVLELDLDVKSALLNTSLKTEFGSEKELVVLGKINRAIRKHSKAHTGGNASLVSGELNVAIAIVDVRTVSPLLDTSTRIIAPILEDGQDAVVGGIRKAGRRGNQE